MKKVIYSLTGRGLYSELLNLVLAKIYCDYYKYELIINTYYWNSKGKYGWQDFFEPTVKNTNDISSSQVFFNGSKHKLSLRGIYKNPSSEMVNIMQTLINRGYKIKSGNLLSDDIVDLMRAPIFMDQIGNNEVWRQKFQTNIEEMYVFNESIKCEIQEMKQEIGVCGIDFIGVHIRRGDKIKSKEMKFISMEKYAEAIIKQKHISSNVYIATDDSASIGEIKKLLGSSFNVLFNTKMSTNGFDESKYNRKTKQQRVWETKLALLDVDILKESSFFIGTYSSNLSRIIPCFKGFDTCESLDLCWTPVF